MSSTERRSRPNQPPSSPSQRRQVLDLMNPTLHKEHKLVDERSWMLAGSTTVSSSPVVSTWRRVSPSGKQLYLHAVLVHLWQLTIAKTPAHYCMYYLRLESATIWKAKSGTSRYLCQNPNSLPISSLFFATQPLRDGKQEKESNLSSQTLLPQPPPTHPDDDYDLLSFWTIFRNKGSTLPVVQK